MIFKKDESFIINGLNIGDIVKEVIVKEKIKYAAAKKNSVQKQYIGHEPTQITVVIEVQADYEYKSAESKINSLQNLFGNQTTGARTYSISNSHLLSRGIKSVVLESIESKEDDKRNCIKVVLNFSKATATLSPSYTQTSNKSSKSVNSKNTIKKDAISPIQTPPDLSGYIRIARIPGAAEHA